MHDRLQFFLGIYTSAGYTLKLGRKTTDNWGILLRRPFSAEHQGSGGGLSLRFINNRMLTSAPLVETGGDSIKTLGTMRGCAWPRGFRF